MTWKNKLLWIYIFGLAVSISIAIQPELTDPRIIEHPEDQYVAKNEPATLNCKAEGNPPPVISWYKDGQSVITSHENPSSHRMLLPSGQLFFLRIIHNKNQRPDIGIYYCNATNPTTGVSVISRTAKLEIAVIRDDFRVQPQNTEVAIGDTAVLDCKGPKGLPEPRLKWKKDGEVINAAENPRYTAQDTGSLMIQNARKEDTGIYVCIAHNNAGEKDSDPARLLVLEKPQFEQAPEDTLAQEGQDVEFQCQASGDPSPTIFWTKEEGRIPEGRSQVLPDKSLRIENVRVSDEGVYICRAENSVGYEEGAAKLTVHSAPSFIITPQDKTVGVGRRVSFRCQVTGNPPPAVFWNKENSKTLWFPHQENGRFKVEEDGTLIIEPVRKEDEGEYICQGLSLAGSAYTKALLEVKDIDPRPPPIIHQGPQNQTLPVDSVAMLRCSSSGDPRPTISWMKDNRLLDMNDQRITQLGSGTLQISDLKATDTGVYTCKATSETGETVWSAGLVVEAPTNPQVIFHRTPEPSTFPGAPSKPQVVNIEENSITLSWKANSNHGASPVYAYIVEYYSHETSEGWVVAADNIQNQEYMVRNLRADTPYMFLVRAQNSHGLSLPSRVTDPIRTGGTGSGILNPGMDPQIVTAKLEPQIMEMKDPKVISSTAIELNWQVKKNQKYIEGFHIKYRIMPESRSGPNPDTTETVTSGTQTTHILRNLKKYTWYEIRVQPYYHTIQGKESSAVRVRTFQDIPAVAPGNIQTIVFDNNTAKVTWDPPPKDLTNGPIIGYKVFVHGNGTRFMRTNKTVVFIKDIQVGGSYKVQVLAYNSIGDGVKSREITIGEDHREKWYQQKWVVGLIVGVVAAFICIGLCAFSVWLHKKKRAKKKGAHFAKNGILTTPLNKAEESARPNISNQTQPLLSSSGGVTKDMTANNGRTLYPPLYPPLQSVQQQQQQQPDVTNVGNPNSDQMSEQENYYNTPNLQPMKTFYNKNQALPPGPVSPYATTTLLQNPNTVAMPQHSGSSAFRPIQNGSNDSCGKPEMTSSDSNNETRSNAVADLPSYNKPNFPTTGGQLPTGPSPRSPPGGSGGAPGQMNIRTNPLHAFDTTDTPIV